MKLPSSLKNAILLTCLFFNVASATPDQPYEKEVAEINSARDLHIQYRVHYVKSKSKKSKKSKSKKEKYYFPVYFPPSFNDQDTHTHLAEHEHSDEGLHPHFITHSHSHDGPHYHKDFAIDPRRPSIAPSLLPSHFPSERPSRRKPLRQPTKSPITTSTRSPVPTCIGKNCERDPRPRKT